MKTYMSHVKYSSCGGFPQPLEPTAKIHFGIRIFIHAIVIIVFPGICLNYIELHLDIINYYLHIIVNHSGCPRTGGYLKLPVLVCKMLIYHQWGTIFSDNL